MPLATPAQIPVADLLRRLDNLMLDVDRVRWDAAERIDWLNDAAREIVLRRPAARALVQSHALTAGTRQQCEAGASQLLNVVRNLGPAGQPGRAIGVTDLQQMDRAAPDWHSGAAGATRQFMVDERNPVGFYVYPPAVDGALVEVLVAAPPPAVTSSADALDMRPEFLNAIINWALYRCHTKDSEYAQGAVATQHYQAFTDAIGAPAQAAQVNSSTGNNA
jgi:hypothetical protein